MQVLITGISSFLGGSIALRLSQLGIGVLGTYRTDDHRVASIKLADSRIELVQLPLEDRGVFSQLPNKIDAVFHFAGVSHATASPDEIIRCNILGTEHIANYALDAQAGIVVYASSLSVYGTVTESVVTQNTPFRDVDLYGASKFMGERILADKCKDMPVTCWRLPGILGPGAHRAFIPALLNAVMQGEDVQIYNGSTNFNNAVHVKDLAEFGYGLLRRELPQFSAYPLGAAGYITLGDLVAEIIRRVGSKSRVSIDPTPRQGFVISSDFAIRELGYKPMDIKLMMDMYVAETLGVR